MGYTPYIWCFHEIRLWPVRGLVNQLSSDQIGFAGFFKPPTDINHALVFV
jgi:hypothetical protein